MISLGTIVLFVVTALSVQYNCIMAQLASHSETEASNSLFAGDLHSIIADNKSTQNIVYSPAAIYTCLAFTYLGADGLTAEEIRQVLRVGQQKDKLGFALEYGDFLKSTFKKTKPEDNAPQLTMATRLYVNSKIKIVEQFNRLALENFECQAENVDFSQASSVAKEINKWVEDRTESKISHIIRPEAINGDTSAILVNAIYFKAKWLHPFSVSSTSKNDFHINRSQKVEVDTMFTDDRFNYVELDDLEATALEMPYENSNMSMLIILPNQIDGLGKLEKRLKGINFGDIISKMVEQDVDVFLPKFRIEFDIDLKESLGKMGCSSMFAQNANLSGIFESVVPQRISDIKHKAFFDCNEAGSEAAAATYMKIVPMSLNFDQKTFRANYPFFFAVLSKSTAIFAGHVTKFP